MNTFSNFLWRTGNYLVSMRLSDVIDILVVAYLIYQVLMLIRRTNARNLAKGVLIFILFLGLSAILGLTMTNFILKKGIELGLVAIVILFQPELRRLLERIGSRVSSSNRDINKDISIMESAIKQVVLASSDMSDSKTGALIIFERNFKLNEIMDTGTHIDAEVNAELIKNIFYDKAPLHDGALIIRDGRISAAGCVLPLTKSKNLSKDLGMRHRAGIGLSEESDAIVLIVSEETGSISIALDGMLKRHLNAKTVDNVLRTELLKDEVKNSDNKLTGILKKFIFSPKSWVNARK